LRHAILVMVHDAFMPGDLDNVEEFVEDTIAAHKRYVL